MLLHRTPSLHGSSLRKIGPGLTPPPPLKSQEQLVIICKYNLTFTYVLFLLNKKVYNNHHKEWLDQGKIDCQKAQERSHLVRRRAKAKNSSRALR